jgi:hypothetical protein
MKTTHVPVSESALGAERVRGECARVVKVY